MAFLEFMFRIHSRMRTGKKSVYWFTFIGLASQSRGVIKLRFEQLKKNELVGTFINWRNSLLENTIVGLYIVHLKLKTKYALQTYCNRLHGLSKSTIVNSRLNKGSFILAAVQPFSLTLLKMHYTGKNAKQAMEGISKLTPSPLSFKV